MLYVLKFHHIYISFSSSLADNVWQRTCITTAAANFPIAVAAAPLYFRFDMEHTPSQHLDFGIIQKCSNVICSGILSLMTLFFTVLAELARNVPRRDSEYSRELRFYLMMIVGILLATGLETMVLVMVEYSGAKLVAAGGAKEFLDPWITIGWIVLWGVLVLAAMVILLAGQAIVFTIVIRAAGESEKRSVENDDGDDKDNMWLMLSWCIIGALLALAAASEETGESRRMLEHQDGPRQPSRDGWVTVVRFYVASLMALMALKMAGVKKGIARRLVRNGIRGEDGGEGGGLGDHVRGGSGINGGEGGSGQRGGEGDSGDGEGQGGSGRGGDGENGGEGGSGEGGGDCDDERVHVGGKRREATAWFIVATMAAMVAVGMEFFVRFFG